jgi:hypothetical protein
VVQELFSGAWGAGRVGRLSRPVTAPQPSLLIAPHTAIDPAHVKT